MILDVKVATQFEYVRKEGTCNMMDFNGVQVRANELEFYALVVWLQENRKDYATTIFKGYDVKLEEGSVDSDQYFKDNPVEIENLEEMDW